MKASDLLVAALENEGVKHIFGVPGEENLDFLESIRKSSIQLILTRHEQAAAFMAATYGRLTGHAGVCLSTLGPGATNLVTGAAFAQLGGMPMLMITGQKPIKKSKQGRFQIVDIVAMMQPLTKFSDQVVHGDLIPSLVREAFQRAQGERPGAVHLELPEDIAEEEASSTQLFSVRPVQRPCATQKAIEDAVAMIRAAKRPLLMVGAAANRNRACQALRHFVQELQMPFFTTQMGKGVIDERSPMSLGTAALSDHDYIHAAIANADLIINVGHDVIEKPPFFMHPDGVKVIHVNNFPSQVDEVYFPQLNVIGDIATSINALTAQLEPSRHWDFSIFKQAKTGIDKHIHSKADDPSFPVIPQRLVADVRAAMPEDGIIALDNGMYKIWFARNYLAYDTNTVLLDNALATMGAGLPAGIATKLVHPDRKVMAVCGDGGFMMNSHELETAVRLGVDLVVLILRDNAYGMIKWKQASLGFADYGLDFTNPDFVQFAESFGAEGVRIAATDELLPTLKQRLDSKGVHIIEVPVDYSENEKVLTDELKKATLDLQPG